MSKYPTFEAYVQGVEKKVALEVFKRIVARTPVDTGLARDSWVLSGSAPNYLISNPQPYINKLEHGSSKQAPAGMVRITLAELENIAETIKAQENG